MQISVIIPAYNEEKFLRQTLTRIQQAIQENEAKGATWEIIVCDNNSNDKTAVVASEMGATVAFEAINQISRARNSGADLAQGDWFLFVDADTYPQPALIAEIFAVIAAGNFIGCGTTIVVEGGTLFNKLRMERLNPLFRLFNWSGGACLLVQRNAFQAIGGFSTDLFAYEEIDFVMRLKRYGRKQGKQFTILSTLR